MEPLLQYFVSPLIAAGLTLFFGLRQHRSTHFWNEKFAAYSAIIQALEDSAKYSMEAFNFHDAQDNFEKWGSSPHDSKIDPSTLKRYIDAQALLNKSILTSGWIVTPKVSELVLRQPTLKEVNGEVKSDYLYWCDASAFYMDLLQDVIREARWDLGLHDRWYRRLWNWLGKYLPLAW